MSSVENNTELVHNLNLSEASEDILTEIWNAVLQVFREDELPAAETAKLILPAAELTNYRDICFEEMLKTSSHYQETIGSATSTSIDFTNVFTRWAYIYVFMLRHVHLVYKALSSPLLDMKRLLPDDDQQMGSVCAIGGGPAIDVFGLMVAFLECSIVTPFAKEAYVLDNCVKWEDSYETLYRNLSEKLQMRFPCVKYHHFDFKENQLSPDVKNIIREARLVTMVKSLSPVAAYMETVKKEFSEENDGSQPTINSWHSLYGILSAVSLGHYVMYIDNQTGPQHKLLMDAVDALNYEVLFDSSMAGVKLPKGIVSSTLSEEIATLLHDYKPCVRAGRNEMILLRKKCD